MCGIAGFWSSRSHGEECIQAMTLSLRHRGPDEQRWVSPAAGVWFGHARLRVIDLTATGCQPMVRAGRPGCLVFNGEIYNHREIRTELEAGGETFRGTSDSEVLLSAYQVWGEGCLERLRGMFAFAIWDEARQGIFLARDRAGKKPLFYVHREGLMAFGSEPKALLRHPEVDPRVRPGALPSLAGFGYPPTGKSAFEEIRQLPPGTRGLFRKSDGSWKQETFWRPRWKRSSRPPGFAEAARETRRLLEKAVRQRLGMDIRHALWHRF